MFLRPCLMHCIYGRLVNRTTSNAALRLCVFCRVLICGRANLGIHGKYSRFAIFLTDIWQNIGGLLDFACILAKLYTSFGFRGKVMDLYIVIKMHLYQYIDSISSHKISIMRVISQEYMLNRPKLEYFCQKSVRKIEKRRHLP